MDYSNGKIYTIRSSQTDKYYIGSTTTSLAKRFSKHKCAYNTGDLYITSAEIFKYEDAYIELLEDYPCGSKNELNKREGQLIRQYKNECVNNNIAGRSKSEYQYDNKDIKKEYDKKYRDENKEKILERLKQNEDIIRENKKQYRQKNKDKIKEYNKQWQQKNKDKIKEQ